MDTIQIVLGILLGVISLVLVFLVMAQSGKEKGLSGAIGGSSETYFGKANTANKEKILNTVTVVMCILLFGLLLALVVLSK